MPIRIDHGRVSNYRIDHNGNLVVTGVLTRDGVFTYKHNDGRVTHELRHIDDVFNAESVSSFVQVPVTNKHPVQGAVTPDNVRRLAVGNVGDKLAREDTDKDSLLVADLYVRDAEAIEAVNNRRKFLSCGYTVDVVPEEGTYKGVRYDHRQTNIRGNHVALVDNPRAGTVARLKMDADDAEMDLVHLDGVAEEDKSAWVEKKIAALRRDGKTGLQASAIANKLAEEGKLDEIDEGPHPIHTTTTGKHIYQSAGRTPAPFLHTLKMRRRI